MNDKDLQDLKKAHQLLSTPSVTMKVANYIGKPIELGLESLPEGAAQTINEISKVSLNKALAVALYTIQDAEEEASPWWHKTAAAVSGGRQAKINPMIIIRFYGCYDTPAHCFLLT